MPGEIRLPSKLLTTIETAAILGVCTRTLRSHVNAGELAYVNVGRGTQREQRMFRLADVERFIESRVRYKSGETARVVPRRSSGAFVYDFTKPRAGQVLSNPKPRSSSAADPSGST